MSDKKFLTAFLMLVVAALALYVVFADREKRTQDGNEDDVNQIIADPPTPTPYPVDMEQESAQPLVFAGKSWWLDEVVVSGEEISLDVSVPSALTLTFDQNKKDFNGFSGCNNYFGEYTSDGQGQLNFGAIGATKKFCEGVMDVEAGIFKAMENIDNYSFDAQKNLILESADKQTRLRYVPAA